MKKSRLFLIAALTLCLLTACDNLKKEYHVSSKSDSSKLNTYSSHSIWSSSDFNLTTMPKIDNETPYQELLTKEIDIHEFIQKYCLHAPFGSGTIENIASDFEIQCLRETELGALYSIHKVKQDGLLYIFYMNELEEAPGYHPIIRWFYMQNKLSFKDFATIKEGSTVDDIKKIDPVAQVWENIYHADPQYWEKTGGCGTLHYLSDGILEIGFKNQNGKLTVFAKRLTEDFDMPQFSGRSYPYNGLILEQDWVTE